MRADPTRIAAQIVTGIGFLGAGAIIRDGLSVRGLTTAATTLGRCRDRHGVRRGVLLARCRDDRAHTAGALAAADHAYRTIERMRPEEHRLIVELQEARPLARSSLSSTTCARISSCRRARPTGRAARARRQVDEELVGPSLRSPLRDRCSMAAAEAAVLALGECGEARGDAQGLPRLGHPAPRGDHVSRGGRRDLSRERAHQSPVRALSRGPPRRWMLADDSGIEIEALGEGPGVQTARWAEGRHVEKTLEALKASRTGGRGTSPSSCCSRPRRAEILGAASSRGRSR